MLKKKCYLTWVAVMLVVMWSLSLTSGCSDDDDDTIQQTPTATPTTPPSGTRFTQTYGGPDLDEGISVLAMQNGNYMIGGITRSYGTGQTDFYLIRTDCYGNEIWTWPHVYGGPHDDYCIQVIETDDGSFLLLGNTDSFGAGSSDIYVLKVDSDGTYLWSRTYGGAGYDWANAICSDGQGNFYICGNTNSHTGDFADILLLKINSDGNEIWSLTMGGDYGDFCYSLDWTADGNLILAGGTYSFGAGDEDVYVLKVDPQGSILWSRTYGGQDRDQAFSVRGTDDGGAIICGETWPYMNDIYLLRIDVQGNELWTKTFGGECYDWGRSVRQTADRGFILCGTTDSFGSGDGDIYLIKIDSHGNPTWSRTYGGPASETAYTVELSLDGGYVISGSTASFGEGFFDVYLIKTDELGHCTP